MSDLRYGSAARIIGDSRASGPPFFIARLHAFALRSSSHSARKAITGSILVARLAGSQAAHSATSSKVTDNTR